MLNLHKSISINAWYSKELPWRREETKQKQKTNDCIQFNKYGFFINPYLELKQQIEKDN